MPGENFSRRVARAAAVGGGRTYRSQTPRGWYALLLVICVGGTSLVAYSRYERTHPVTAPAAAAKKSVPPTTSNLWEAALAVDICGHVSYLPASTNPAQAFTTDGKGVVTIEPVRSPMPAASEGKNAVLEGFLLGANVSLSPTSLGVPSTLGKTTTTTTTTTPNTTTTTTSPTTTTTTSTANSSSSSTTSVPSSTTSPTTTSTTLAPVKMKNYANGQSCEGKPGKVQVEVWAHPNSKKGTLVRGDPSQLRFANGQLITIAFLPKGAPIPQPSSKKSVANFLIADPGGSAPTTPTSGSTPTASTPSVSTPTAPSTSGTTPSSTTTGSTSNGKGSKTTGT